MNTVILWILISTSTGGYNTGNVTVVDRFPTEGDCNWVLVNMPANHYTNKCIQAKVVR